MLTLLLACHARAPQVLRPEPPKERRLVAMLHGGGPESDALYGRFVAESGSGTIVTLGSSDPADPYRLFFDGYFVSLGAERAMTVNTTSRADAEAFEAVAAIDEAAAIFIRGGDQSAYLQQWQGTALHQALLRARDRGVPIAGSSAGCALLGERIYDARVSSVDSWQVLDDPFHPGLTFTEDLLDLLPGVLTDTHFTERGRLGRLAVFLGRWQQEGRSDILGLGIDPETALFVYNDGTAEVQGTGSVTVLFPAEEVTLAPGLPASLKGMRLWQLPAGYTVDLRVKGPDGPGPDGPVRSRPDWVSPAGERPALAGWPERLLDGDSLQDRRLGDRIIPEIDEAGWPWYRGRLTEASGDGVLPGSFVLTSLFDDSDHFEAHVGGLLWTLARHPGTVGLGLDIGDRAQTSAPASLTVLEGWALVLDPRTATWAGDPGAAPQTVALEGATLEILAEGERWDGG